MWVSFDLENQNINGFLADKLCGRERDGICGECTIDRVEGLLRFARTFMVHSETNILKEIHISHRKLWKKTFRDKTICERKHFVSRFWCYLWLFLNVSRWRLCSVCQKFTSRQASGFRAVVNLLISEASKWIWIRHEMRKTGRRVFGEDQWGVCTRGRGGNLHFYTISALQRLKLASKLHNSTGKSQQILWIAWTQQTPFPFIMNAEIYSPCHLLGNAISSAFCTYDSRKSSIHRIFGRKCPMRNWLVY